MCGRSNTTGDADQCCLQRAAPAASLHVLSPALCLLQLLPDLSKWTYAGTVKVANEQAHAWQLDMKNGEKVATYTFVVSPSGGQGGGLVQLHLVYCWCAAVCMEHGHGGTVSACAPALHTVRMMMQHGHQLCWA
jgi:hypothetical protein